MGIMTTPRVREVNTEQIAMSSGQNLNLPPSGLKPASDEWGHEETSPSMQVSLHLPLEQPVLATAGD